MVSSPEQVVSPYNPPEFFLEVVELLRQRSLTSANQVAEHLFAAGNNPKKSDPFFDELAALARAKDENVQA